MHLYQINFILCTATLPGMWERTVTIGSAGKTYSVTGWKVRRININELNYIECIYYSKNTSVFMTCVLKVSGKSSCLQNVTIPFSWSNYLFLTPIS